MKFYAVLSLFYLLYAFLVFLNDTDINSLAGHITLNFNLMLINIFFQTYSNTFECLSKPTQNNNF